MKKFYLTLFTCLYFIIMPSDSLKSMEISDFKMQAYYRPFYTKEEFYSLYRENMHRREDNLNANIFWLEHAKKAPFGIPVKALAKIESQLQWNEYQRLFLFHINFLMMDNYIKLAAQYEKPHILFFNNIFKKEIKEGLEMSKIYYKRALISLEDSLKIGAKAWDYRDDSPLSLDGDLDKWADTLYRLLNPERFHRMNYKKELNLRLKQVDDKIKRVDALKEP